MAFEPANGVKVQINESDHLKIRGVAMLPTTLKIASVANERERTWHVFWQKRFGWLEVDGIVYRYNGRRKGRGTHLPPGAKFEALTVELLDPAWQDRDGIALRRRWNDGMHEIRYAAQLGSGKDKQPYGAWSNKISVAGSLFKGTFSQQGQLGDEAKVSLVGLSDYPRGKNWWTPDGKKLADPLFDNLGMDIRSKQIPNTKAIELFFQIEGVKGKQAFEILHRSFGDQSGTGVAASSEIQYRFPTSNR